MIGYSVLFASYIAFFLLIRKDIRDRPYISSAIWIPTAWVFILSSRPLSAWLNFGGASDTLEGSPVDRIFYFGMILAALFVLARRNLNWSDVLRRNWPIFLFYGYFLLSIFWSPEPYVSFKRWFKDFGNVFIALVILTELNPHHAFRSVFVRCAYVLLPLSIVFIRYFPELGRRYMRGGGLQVIGVTEQKNSLGILVVICGLALIWDWLERTRPGAPTRTRTERFLPLIFISIGAYLLFLCDSKTSLMCLLIGGGILASIRIPALQKRVGRFGILLLIVFGLFYTLDAMFGIKGALLGALGRDESMTGRTDVWRELLALNTDPLVGTGFCSIWSDQHLLSKLPIWVGKSAHNSYLEVFIDGGWIGICFLALMMVPIGFRLNRYLATGTTFALMRFAVFVAMLIGSVSESHWCRMSPLNFLLLLVTIEPIREQEDTDSPSTSDTESGNETTHETPESRFHEPKTRVVC